MRYEEKDHTNNNGPEYVPWWMLMVDVGSSTKFPCIELTDSQPCFNNQSK